MSHAIHRTPTAATVILTVTPNPSLDLLFTAERLVWDDANRIPMPRRRPGGQGLNLVRAARALRPDVPVLAVTPLGGRTGRELGQALREEGTPVKAVPIDQETRVFVGTRELDTGRSLLLNPEGPKGDERVADALSRAVVEALEALEDPGLAHAAGHGSRVDADSDRSGETPWVVCCGSLLPGLPTDLYARIGREAHSRGARFVPDCDGEALAAAAEHADLLVPNDMEAARLSGRAIRSAEDAADVGRSLLQGPVERVVITLGARGAVWVSPAGAWWAWPELPTDLSRRARGGSAVGAGDAFLASLLLEPGPADLEDTANTASSEEAALMRAVATGTAVLLGRGDTLVDPADVERVRPHVRSRPLD